MKRGDFALLLDEYAELNDRCGAWAASERPMSSDICANLRKQVRDKRAAIDDALDNLLKWASSGYVKSAEGKANDPEDS